MFESVVLKNAWRDWDAAKRSAALNDTGVPPSISPGSEGRGAAAQSDAAAAPADERGECQRPRWTQTLLTW